RKLLSGATRFIWLIQGTTMFLRRRRRLFVCVLALIGGAILWWWPTPDRPIAFVMASANDRPVDLMAMALDGSAQTRLVVGDQAGFDPAWSPDGQSLAFAHGDLF